MAVQFRTAYLASAALTGVLIPPLIVIWIASFFTCRRRPFVWLGVSLPSLAIAYACNMIQQALVVVLSDLDSFSQANLHEEEAAYRMADVGNLFASLGLIFLLLCIVDLGLSFLYIWNRDRKGHSTVLGVTALLGFTLFAIAVAQFAEFELYWARRFSTTNFYDQSLTPLNNGIKLHAAFDIALWALSLATAAFATYVFCNSTGQSQLRRSACIFLIISILFLLRCSWNFGFDVKYSLKLLNEDVFIPNYTIILSPILDFWPTFIASALIFAVGTMNHDEFSSNDEPCKESEQGVPQQGFTSTQYYPQAETMQQHAPLLQGSVSSARPWSAAPEIQV